MHRPQSLIAVLLGMLIFPLSLNAAQLVVNGDFSSGNTAFSSQYTFVPHGSSTSPGQYAIVADPSIDLTNGYPSFKDHTDGSGSMLLGDGTPSLVLWSQTVAVSPGTAYTFSTWATAAISSFPPTVRFTANNVALGPDMGLSATAGSWQHFTATYNSGVATSVTLRILDVRSGAPTGNDLALDDISLDTFVAPPVPLLLPTWVMGLASLLIAGAVMTIRKRRRNEIAEI